MSLDASKNVVLSDLLLQSNNLTTEALDILFGTLHDNTIPDIDKKVYIFNNPGTNSFTHGTVINGFSIITTP